MIPGPNRRDMVGSFFLNIGSRGQGKGHVGAMLGGVDMDLYSTPISMVGGDVLFGSETRRKRSGC